MPRPPSLKYRQTPDGSWLVNVPGSLSDTGRFRRRYFRTRDEAKAECQRLREVLEGRREKATDIRPALAEDATAAAEILERFGVTLKQAAAFYADHHDTRARLPKLSEAWEAAIERRASKRKDTLRGLKAWKKLPAWFMAMNVADIEPAHIEKALSECTKGDTHWNGGRACISQVLGDCVRYMGLAENPVARVDKRKSGAVNDEQAEDVSVYTADELKKLLAACKDYKDGLDRKCSACRLPFAFMAFAGIRPTEVTKLRWENVSASEGTIHIGKGVAKKSQRRNIRIHPTLQAWIETVPKEQRRGKIVPGRWPYRAARVRREAGIDGHEKQDALRHSFGSYLYAVEKDDSALIADMGQEHFRTFRDFYMKAVHAKDAIAYWGVVPEGAEKPKTIKVA